MTKDQERERAEWVFAKWAAYFNTGQWKHPTDLIESHGDRTEIRYGGWPIAEQTYAMWKGLA